MRHLPSSARLSADDDGAVRAARRNAGEILERREVVRAVHHASAGISPLGDGQNETALRVLRHRTGVDGITVSAKRPGQMFYLRVAFGEYHFNLNAVGRPVPGNKYRRLANAPRKRGERKSDFRQRYRHRIARFGRVVRNESAERKFRGLYVGDEVARRARGLGESAEHLLEMARAVLGQHLRIKLSERADRGALRLLFVVDVDGAVLADVNRIARRDSVLVGRDAGFKVDRNFGIDVETGRSGDRRGRNGRILVLRAYKIFAHRSAHSEERTALYADAADGNRILADIGIF